MCRINSNWSVVAERCAYVLFKHILYGVLGQMFLITEARGRILLSYMAQRCLLRLLNHMVVQAGGRIRHVMTH